MRCPHCGEIIDMKDVKPPDNLPRALSARIKHIGRDVFIIEGRAGLWSRRPEVPFSQDPVETAEAKLVMGKGHTVHKLYRLPSLEYTLRHAVADDAMRDLAILTDAVTDAVPALRRELPMNGLMHGSDCVCGSGVCYAHRTLSKAQKT